MDLWGTRWGYARTWAWDYVRSEYTNAGYSMAQLSAILQQFLNHEDVITLGELPILPWSNLAADLPGDYNLDGTVNAADYTVWRDSFGRDGQRPGCRRRRQRPDRRRRLRSLAAVLRRNSRQRRGCQRGCPGAGYWLATVGWHRAHLFREAAPIVRTPCAATATSRHC